MTIFTNQSRNASTFSISSRASTAFKNFLRHGKEPNMAELADYIFTDVVFEDGTILQNVTFAQLIDITWSLQTKN